METCSDDDQCCCGLSCTSNLCQCKSNRWFNSQSSYCEKRSLYKEYCQNLDQCLYGRNLTCELNKCSCPYLTYWDGMYCQNKLTYMENCTTVESCNYEVQNLTCNKYDHDTNKCICDFETEFWNITSLRCESKVTFGSKCNQTLSACQTSSNNLYCLNQFCNCSSNYYWSSSIQKCRKYIKFIIKSSLSCFVLFYCSKIYFNFGWAL